MTSGWSEPKVDKAIAGGPLSIGGKTFASGIGAHANIKFRVDLGGKARRFTAEVGVNDTANAQGSVEFIVIGWRAKNPSQA